MLLVWFGKAVCVFEQYGIHFRQMKTDFHLVPAFQPKILIHITPRYAVNKYRPHCKEQKPEFQYARLFISLKCTTLRLEERYQCINGKSLNTGAIQL